MKKRMKTAALILSLVMLSGISVAAVEVPIVTETAGSYTTTYKGTAGKQYVLLVVKKDTDLSKLTTDSILYIDQAAAGTNNEATFSNFKLKNKQSADVYIGGQDMAAPAVSKNAIQVSGVPVSGKVIYQGNYSTATVALKDKATGTTLYTTQTDTNGNYTLDAVTEGEYTLSVTKNLYLTYTKKSVVVAAQTMLPDVNIEKLGGDINASGKINSTDLVPLLKNFNQSDPKQDINGSGRVNSNDLSILLAAFNQTNVTVD